MIEFPGESKTLTQNKNDTSMKKRRLARQAERNISSPSC